MSEKPWGCAIYVCDRALLCVTWVLITVIKRAFVIHIYILELCILSILKYTV